MTGSSHHGSNGGGQDNPLGFHRHRSNATRLCGWSACERRNGRYAKAGHYRVTLMGYPWRDADGLQLYVCETCRRDMLRVYAQALSTQPTPQSDGPGSVSDTPSAEPAPVQAAA